MRGIFVPDRILPSLKRQFRPDRKPPGVDFELHAEVVPNRLYYVHTQTVLPGVAWLTYQHPPGDGIPGADRRDTRRQAT